MPRNIKLLVFVSLLVGVAFAPVKAAEREQVRIVVNLMAAVKMPYPEDFYQESGQDPAGLAREGRCGYRCLPAKRGPQMVLRAHPRGGCASRNASHPQ